MALAILGTRETVIARGRMVHLVDMRWTWIREDENRSGMGSFKD
jgi:hypothetical protein